MNDLFFPSRRSVTMPTCFNWLRCRENGGQVRRSQMAQIVDTTIAEAQCIEHQDPGGMCERLQNTGLGFGLGVCHAPEYMHICANMQYIRQP